MEDQKEKPFGVMLDLTKEEKLDLDLKLADVSKELGRKVTNRELFMCFTKSFINKPAEIAKSINL
jgi:hypothetical protein